MCETFLFYHLCGHVYSKKIWKCSKEIAVQVHQTRSDQGVRHHTQPCSAHSGSCLYCHDLETFLKPTLCEKCEQAGIISDWLNSDPAIRFEIVKEWLHVKAADRKNEAESSTSAENSKGLRAPSIRAKPSRIEIVDSEGSGFASLEQISPLLLGIPITHKPEPLSIPVPTEKDSKAQMDALEVMTPILVDYLSEAESVEAEVEAIEQKIEQQAQNVQVDAKSTDDLKARTAVIRKKLEALIAESTQRSRARLCSSDGSRHSFVA